MRQPKLILFLTGILCSLLLSSCGASSSKKPRELVASAEEMPKKTIELILDHLALPDSSLKLSQADIVHYLYKEKNAAIWSDKETWKPMADNFFRQLENCRLLGLFPEDYHFLQLKTARDKINADTAARSDRKDPEIWAHADIFLTDAFIQFIHDVKLGRLPNDSITLNKDSSVTNEEYMAALQSCSNADSLNAFLTAIQPTEKSYWQLKNGISRFLDGASFKEYTHVPSPSKDSIGYRRALQKRLFEENYLSQDSVLVDSAAISSAVKKFQKDRNITVDGRVGEGTLRMLNLSDKDKFIRIAISLDKYKKLPHIMPEKYIWVNVSGNMMDVVENGKTQFNSRVITGKPLTRTPMLTSAISQLITYPQWVPPPSIIMKEILPAVKKNPGYITKKGFSLLDSKGDEVDPFSVDWSKYNKSIPYKVVQGSGDANALGVMKFFFDNKYSVYLHDTNQRYLFASSMRNMSHGCVRVQEWRTLLHYILENDSLHYTGTYTKMDSVQTWLKNKERRQLALKARMPVFIRYFTCAGSEGGIVFFDDVYGDDKMLRQKYFAGK